MQIQTNLPAGSFTDGERALINSGSGPMRVLRVTDSRDSVLLRERSVGAAGLAGSEPMRTLCRRMVETVTAPENDEVGIAAPQVGILRRVIAVQRFDREGEPFGIYLDPVILAHSPHTINGTEGCLSIEGVSGTVPRYSELTIRYRDPETGDTVTEEVSGFTAVIFQHEIDHLDGILFTDRMIEDE